MKSIYLVLLAIIAADTADQSKLFDTQSHISVMREWNQKEREIERNLRLEPIQKVELPMEDSPLERLSREFAMKATRTIELPEIRVH